MVRWNLAFDAITAVATAATAVMAWRVVRERRQEKQPYASGRLVGREGSSVPKIRVEITVRNPSRRAMQLRRITVVQPENAVFLNGTTEQNEMEVETTIEPLGIATREYKLRLLNGDNSSHV